MSRKFWSSRFIASQRSAVVYSSFKVVFVFALGLTRRRTSEIKYSADLFRDLRLIQLLDAIKDDKQGRCSKVEQFFENCKTGLKAL